MQKWKALQLAEDIWHQEFQNSDVDKSGFLDLSEYVLVLHRASESAKKTTPAAPGQEVPQNELLQARGFLPPGNTRYEEYLRMQETFVQITGDVTTNKPIPEEECVKLFVQHHPGLTFEQAIAGFKQYDLDGSKGLNLHEYVLLSDDMAKGVFSLDGPTAKAEEHQTEALVVLGYLPDAQGNHRLQLELTQFQHDFQNLDIDGTGTLTQQQFIAHAIQQWAITCDEASAMFLLHDKDRSGLLNLHEYILLRHDMVMQYGRSVHRPHAELRVVIDKRARFGLGAAPAGVWPGSLTDRKNAFVGLKEIAGSAQAGVVSKAHPKSAYGRNFDDFGAVTAGFASPYDWRGIVVTDVYRADGAFRIAKFVEDNARQLAFRTAGESHNFSHDWTIKIRDLFKDVPSDDLPVMLVTLASAAQKVIRSQSVMVRCSAPCKVIGSIHGQFRDLLLLFREFGFPSADGDIETCTYVFNGNYFGTQATASHQLEVIALLLALKVLYPSKIFLLRGDIDFEEGSDVFKQQLVDAQLGPQTEDVFTGIFDAVEWFPLSALLQDSVLVVHGGIGDGSWGLRELASIQRPIKVRGNPPNLLATVFQALTSNPALSDATTGFRKDGAKSNETEFGQDVTANFCRLNHIKMIIRSNEFNPTQSSAPGGVTFMHSGRIVNVFSARDFGPAHDSGTVNDGGMLLIVIDEAGHLRLRAKRLLRST